MKRRRLFGAAAAAVGALIAALATGAQTDPKPSTPPKPTVPAAFGEPIAAVSYPNDAGGSTVVTLDSNGVSRLCLKGSKAFGIGDVAGGRILYVDGDVFVLPLSCAGLPKRVIGLKQMLGTRPADDRHLTCPRFSRDAGRITVNLVRFGSQGGECDRLDVGEIWAGRADGTEWRRVAEGIGRGWVDDRHILVDGIWDPYAIEADTGRTALFRTPHLWRGSRSPDGSKAIYVEDAGPVFRSAFVGEDDVFRSGSGESHAWIVDRASGERRLAVFPRSYRRSNFMTSMWSPSGELVTDDGSSWIQQPSLLEGRVAPRTLHVRAYDTELVLAGEFHLPDRYTSIVDLRLGWLDVSQVAIGWSRGLLIGDVQTGELRPVTLPGLTTTGGSVFGSSMVVFGDRQREGIPSVEPTLVRVESAPTHRHGAARLAFRLPPSWEVRPCRCAARGYEDGWVAFGRGEPYKEIHFYGLSFTNTRESVSAVRRKLIAAYEADRPVTSDSGAELTTSRRVLGGIPFEVLQFSFYEAGNTILVGRAAGRTFIFELGGRPEADPSLGLILRTIRFG